MIFGLRTFVHKPLDINKLQVAIQTAAPAPVGCWANQNSVNYSGNAYTSSSIVGCCSTGGNRIVVLAPAIVTLLITLHYSLNGHPSGPENWPSFSTFAHMYAAMSYIKMFSDSPSVQYCKKCIQIIFRCVQQAKICYSCSKADEKWWPLTVWTLGQTISQLIAGELDQHGACFGMFLKVYLVAGTWWPKSITCHRTDHLHTTFSSQTL